MSVKSTLSGGALGGGAVLSTATLPYTGFPIWAVAVAGLAAVLIGFAFIRMSRRSEA